MSKWQNLLVPSLVFTTLVSADDELKRLDCQNINYFSPSTKKVENLEETARFQYAKCLEPDAFLVKLTPRDSYKTIGCVYVPQGEDVELIAIIGLGNDFEHSAGYNAIPINNQKKILADCEAGRRKK